MSPADQPGHSVGASHWSGVSRFPSSLTARSVLSQASSRARRS